MSEKLIEIIQNTTLYTTADKEVFIEDHTENHFLVVLKQYAYKQQLEYDEYEYDIRLGPLTTYSLYFKVCPLCKQESYTFDVWILQLIRCVLTLRSRQLSFLCTGKKL